MGSVPSSDIPDVPEPPVPEPVKRAESEGTRVRDNAKNAAAKRFGVAGTNVTKGALASQIADTKKNKLGGA